MWVYIGTSELKNAYIGEYWSPNANTLLYLPLENNYNDVTGNHTITATGTVSKWSIGYIFSNSYIGTADQFVWPTQATISLWLKQTSRTNNWNVATKFIPQTPYHFIGIKYWNSNNSWDSNTYIRPEYSVNNSTPNVLTNTTVQPLNSWLNVVVTHGSLGSFLYVNWVQITSDTITNNLLTTSSWFYVWGIPNYSQYFNGEISKVIYESVQRTAQEVTDYYNKTKSTYWL